MHLKIEISKKFRHNAILRTFEQVQNTKWQIPKWHSGKYPIDIIDLTAVTSQ